MVKAALLLLGVLAYLAITQIADEAAKAQLSRVQNLYTSASLQANHISADSR